MSGGQRIFPVPRQPIWPQRAVPGAKNLGDLTVDPQYYGIQRPEGAASPGSYQPAIAPIVPAPEAPTSQALMDLLARMGPAFITMWRTNFLQIPREVYPFFATDQVSVSGSSSGTVVSYTVPDKMVGFITNLGFNVNSNGWNNLAWSLMVNGTVHPTLAQQNVFANSIANPIPFPLEVTQSSVIALRGTNSAGGALVAEGIIIGWLERMSDAKPYGAAASSGIG